MPRKNELLISGVPLSDEDVKELQALLPIEETELWPLETKSAFNDLVQVVFNDFSPVALARDYIVTEAITNAYNYIKPVIQRLIQKGVNVNNVCIEKDMVSKGGIEFRLYVVTNAQRFEIIIKELEDVSKDKLTPNSHGDTIIVKHDEDGNLEIHIL